MANLITNLWFITIGLTFVPIILFGLNFKFHLDTKLWDSVIYAEASLMLITLISFCLVEAFHW